MPVHGDLLVEVLANGPFVENCYLLADKRTGQAVLVDPGDDASDIAARIRRLKLNPERILNTHGHIDHIGAVAELKREFDIPFWINAADTALVAKLPDVADIFGLPRREVPAIDGDLADGTQIPLGELVLEVIFTPGHTPGGVCLYCATEKVLLTGDTLFARAIGRTDLPGGNTQQLLQAIHERLLTLPDDVVVYPGHGTATTIGEERRQNPFLSPRRL